MDKETIEKVAEALERLANQEQWNSEAWQQCFQLVEANMENELLRYVFDDLIHYDGAFHERNIFGFRTNPDRYELQHYRQEFRDIAAALRSRITLKEAKKRYEL